MEKRSKDFEKVFVSLLELWDKHSKEMSSEDKLSLLTALTLLEDFLVPDKKDLH